jgi:hypothetical protein
MKVVRKTCGGSWSPAQAERDLSARSKRTLAPDTIRPVNEAVDIYLDMTAANRHRLMTGAH